MNNTVLLELQVKVASGQLEFAMHAAQRMLQRRITAQHVVAAISSGQIIEDYPEDVYGPSCLILGGDTNGRMLHVVCSYPQRPLVKIVTVYEPDPALWELGFTERKK